MCVIIFINLKYYWFYLQIAPNMLHKLPLMYPALKMIFAEHFEEMEAKCFKLKLKEEKARAKM